jgi:replicative DNA helicase
VANRAIYAAAITLAEAYSVADYVTIGDVLENRTNGDGSQLRMIGGEAELTRLITHTPTSIHAGHYAEIVHRLAQQRQLIAVSGDIAEAAHVHDGPIDMLYDTVSRQFFDAVDVSAPASHLRGDDDSLADYLANQERIKDKLAANPDALIMTGWADLDWYLGDIEAGMLHVVVARPGVGKTIYLEGVAEHNARKGHTVALYHLELSHALMLNRRMARYSGIPIGRLRRGYQGPELARAIDEIRPWHHRITYIHCAGWSAERIAADMVRLCAKGECDVAIIDYLQKMRWPEKRGANLAALYGLMAETLKNVAENLGIPVITAAQVNRSWKQSANGRPHIEDLRSSGEVHEKCNQAVVLHRPQDREDRRGGGSSETIEVAVEKNTTGDVGRLELFHQLGRFRLVTAARQMQREPEMEF